MNNFGNGTSYVHLGKKIIYLFAIALGCLLILGVSSQLVAQADDTSAPITITAGDTDISSTFNANMSIADDTYTSLQTIDPFGLEFSSVSATYTRNYDGKEQLTPKSVITFSIKQQTVTTDIDYYSKASWIWNSDTGYDFNKFTLVPSIVAGSNATAYGHATYQDSNGKNIGATDDSGNSYMNVQSNSNYLTTKNVNGKLAVTVSQPINIVVDLTSDANKEFKNALINEQSTGSAAFFIKEQFNLVAEGDADSSKDQNMYVKSNIGTLDVSRLQLQPTVDVQIDVRSGNILTGTGTQVGDEISFVIHRDGKDINASETALVRKDGTWAVVLDELQDGDSVTATESSTVDDKPGDGTITDNGLQNEPDVQDAASQLDNTDVIDEIKKQSTDELPPYVQNLIDKLKEVVDQAREKRQDTIDQINKMVNDGLIDKDTADKLIDDANNGKATTEDLQKLMMSMSWKDTDSDVLNIGTSDGEHSLTSYFVDNGTYLKIPLSVKTVESNDEDNNAEYYIYGVDNSGKSIIVDDAKEHDYVSGPIDGSTTEKNIYIAVSDLSAGVNKITLQLKSSQTDKTNIQTLTANIYIPESSVIMSVPTSYDFTTKLGEFSDIKGTIENPTIKIYNPNNSNWDLWVNFSGNAFVNDTAPKKGTISVKSFKINGSEIKLVGEYCKLDTINSAGITNIPVNSVTTTVADENKDPLDVGDKLSGTVNYTLMNAEEPK